MIRFLTKKSFRLFLRRLYLKTTIDREQTRLFHELIEQERVPLRTWLMVLAVPLLYCLLVCMVQDSLVEEKAVIHAALIPENKFNNTPKSQVIARIREQLVHTRPTPKKIVKTLKPGFYTDIKIARLKKRTLEIIQRNMFTPLQPTRSTTTPIKKPSYEKNSGLPICRSTHNFTSSINIIKNVSSFLASANVSLDSIYPMVQKGGFYRPRECKARHRVAIVVPMHKNHSGNLPVFLVNIHPFLKASRLEYQIFVIEQYEQNGSEMNKGRLLNAGFKEAQRFGDWHCVVFHDADLLPLSARVLYTCPKYPRHMSSYIVNDHSNRTDGIAFGGVTSMTLEHYTKVNGHSNLYWGGAEDYDMYLRIIAANLPNVRNSKKVAKYYRLPRNSTSTLDPNKSIFLATAKDRAQYEGLNTIEYSIVALTMHHLYTHIVVDINPQIQRRTF